MMKQTKYNVVLMVVTAAIQVLTWHFVPSVSVSPVMKGKKSIFHLLEMATAMMKPTTKTITMMAEIVVVRASILVTFLKNGTKSLPKLTSENLKHKLLGNGCLAGSHF